MKTTSNFTWGEYIKTYGPEAEKLRREKFPDETEESLAEWRKQWVRTARERWNRSLGRL